MSNSQQAWLADRAARDRFALRNEDSMRDPAVVRAAIKALQTRDMVEALGRDAKDDRRNGIRAAINETDGRTVAIAFAYHPGRVWDDVVRALNPYMPWSTLLDLYEELLAVVRTSELPGLSIGGLRSIQAYLQRQRWLLYAAAFAKPAPAWLGLEQRERQGEPHQLAANARQARLEWMEILEDLDSYPLLQAQIDPVAEVVLITQRQLDASVLSGNDDPPGAVDRDAWSQVIRGHLLPRFVLGTTWQVTWRLAGWPARAATSVAAIAAALAVTVIVAQAASLRPYGLLIGAGLAGLAYVAIVVSVGFDRVASWPWLLRQPAGAAIGLIALIGLDADWWSRSSPRGMWFAAVGGAALMLAATGYVVIEAANHGVQHRLRRVSAVVAMGLLHSVLVAGVGLGMLIPAFAHDGDTLAQCWAGDSCEAVSPTWLLVSTAAAWSFAAGVFSQVLWDDQPFTAPLSHLRWSRGVRS